MALILTELGRAKMGKKGFVWLLFYLAVGIAWGVVGSSFRARMDNESWGISQISNLTVIYVGLLFLVGYLLGNLAGNLAGNLWIKRRRIERRK